MVLPRFAARCNLTVLICIVATMYANRDLGCLGSIVQCMPARWFQRVYMAIHTSVLHVHCTILECNLISLIHRVMGIMLLKCPYPKKAGELSLYRYKLLIEIPLFMMSNTLTNLHHILYIFPHRPPSQVLKTLFLSSLLKLISFLILSHSLTAMEKNAWES